MMISKSKTHIYFLLAIVMLAFFLRFYGLNFGEPYNYHPDETKLVTQAGRLLATKFMDKDAYFGIRVYPPFYTYVLAGAMGVYIGLGLVTGRFESLAAVQTAYETDPFQFFLISRALVAVMGVLSIFIIYLIGKRLYSQKIGLLSALLLAVNFLYVRNSHFGTVDIPAAFFGLICVYFCIRIFQEGKTIFYLLAAVFAAIALATKFSMLIIVFPILFAHFSRFAPREWFKKIVDKKLWLAAGTGIVTFLLACPIIWLDFHETWGGIVGTTKFESVGKIGSGGSLLSYWTGDQSDGFGVFYPNSIPETFGIVLTILAAIGLLYVLIKHRKQDWFILAATIPMYLLFEKMSIKAMRHILPIIPFLLLAATVFVVEMSDKIRQKILRTIVLTVIIFFIVVTQIRSAITYQHALMQTDPRTKATAWIEKNIPAGSAVAVENFPPVLFEKPDHGFELYDTKWTSKTLARRDELALFMSQHDSVFYIADDFTRQTFMWKYTEHKYPEITADRIDFFNSLKTQAERLAEFKSQNPNIQPTITIYLITNTTDKNE